MPGMKRKRSSTAFKRNVKKAIFALTETKAKGHSKDDPLTLGNLSSEWQQTSGLNYGSGWHISQGTGPDERIGARITLDRMRIPMYFANMTPEPLLIKAMVVRTPALYNTTGITFVDPIGNAEVFNPNHPWQADYPVNKEFGTVVKQKKFVLAGAVDFGSHLIGARPISFTGNTGIRKLEMGFSYKNKKIFFDEGMDDEIKGMDVYNLIVYVWRLHGDRVPYDANHLNEGLGNLQIRQFHKLYFKDV